MTEISFGRTTVSDKKKLLNVFDHKKQTSYLDFELKIFRQGLTSQLCLSVNINSVCIMFAECLFK